MSGLTEFEKKRIKEIGINLCSICFVHVPAVNAGSVKSCELEEKDCPHIKKFLLDEQKEIKIAVEECNEVGIERYLDTSTNEYDYRFELDDILKIRGIE